MLREEARAIGMVGRKGPTTVRYVVTNSGKKSFLLVVVYLFQTTRFPSEWAAQISNNKLIVA
jgi:hypothetical protein